MKPTLLNHRLWQLSALALLTCSIQMPALSAPSGPPPAPTSMPAKVLTSTQTTNVVTNANANFIAFSSLPVKTAVLAKATSKAPPGPQTRVVRSANATASVYSSDVKSGVANNGEAAPPYPTDNGANQFLNFKESADAAQSWAMMSNKGQPFLAVWDLGLSKSEVSASWNTTVSVPDSGDQQLYLQFIVPAVTVTGVNEQDGPSRWKSRFRAEILLNGYPVWNTDVMRFNELNGDTEKARHLSQFGASLGHTDGNGESTDGSSQKTVTLYLGRFVAGAALDITALYSAESEVSSACTSKGADKELFCTRGTVVTRPVVSRALPSPRFITVPASTYYPTGQTSP